VKIKPVVSLTVMTFPGTSDHESHDRFPLPLPLPREGEGRFVSRMRDFHIKTGVGVIDEVQPILNISESAPELSATLIGS
jgi:hypothetical protein